ncbi:hypothetical protein [Tepidiforma thermophila]|uniref:VapC45 PIN like domain-containing protein n=1 Tax=Tepidiforma thermophila (strain KCTC 52669 / CGMCC 1.13589 / G233) TaxID=2761530 RepID=A0A2A9HE79_TEPT2|nr:hypothetical protein [Tepidiforma thermophila]PFG73109.1 hypothetical protein A9A59_0303 [Tepidiforma thermophila]
MRLFFDESMGTKVPGALLHIGVPGAEDIERPKRGGPIQQGAADPAWLRWVGQHGYLGLSEDTAILQSVALVDLIRLSNCGLVFLKTGQAPRWEVLRLLLIRWEWLQAVERDVPRPFAFVLGRNRRARRVL